MKYYLKPHVTDEMLQAVGFVKDEESPPMIVWFDRDCLKFKEFDLADDFLIVATEHFDKIRERLFMFNYPQYRFDDNIEDYIQDLIDLGYVEVRND